MRNKEYIEWLERVIETTLEDKALQREHWAFIQAIKKYKELHPEQPEQEHNPNYPDKFTPHA
jgi:hypothetical protein